MLSLDVSISTYQPEGIERIVKMLRSLPQKEGVRYIVSWQEHQDVQVPDYLEKREDVEVWRTDLKGLSNNRNNSIEHCTGDIVLIADDDLEYYPDFAENIFKVFERNQDLDLATFKVDFLNKKIYPEKECKLNLPFPKNYFVTSFEIAFRRERLKDLRFYPELGLGASEMHCGEEELFVASAIKKGYSCNFYPISICRHDTATTGDFVTDEILKAQGFIISVIYPHTVLLRLPLKAFRVSRKKDISFLKSMRQLFKGLSIYLETWKKIPKQYKW